MQDFLTNCANVLQKYGFSYLRGAGTTLLLALVGTFFGCLIGFAVGALQTIPIDKQRDPAWKRVLLRILRVVLRCYVELFRGTPMIVQAVFIYYGLLQVFGIKMGMWTAGFFIVSINTGAYMAETVRGGIVSIDPGQTEGAMAIGMNHWQTMLHVILPQALRNMVPALLLQFVTTIKDTSYLWGAMALQELMGRGMILMNSYNSTVQIFAIFALMAVLTHKKLHPIVIILLSALLGIVTGYLQPA